MCAKIISKASLNTPDILTASKIPPTPPPIELEKCHLNENDIESGEIISNEIFKLQNNKK